MGKWRVILANLEPAVRIEQVEWHKNVKKWSNVKFYRKKIKIKIKVKVFIEVDIIVLIL